VTNEHQTEKTELEKQYEELFTPRLPLLTLEDDSLEQPSPLKIVQSITTGGAYEEPSSRYVMDTDA